LVGGGLGSFVFADYLRLAGVPAPSIRVLSAMTHPWVSAATNMGPLDG
jgi:hypothetical protein